MADDIWVPMGEALLIGHYRPVWNVVVDGFGNHDPGKGRKDQARSPWDTPHPGRIWAEKSPESPRAAAEILALVVDQLSNLARPDLNAPPVVDDELRRALMSEDDA